MNTATPTAGIEEGNLVIRFLEESIAATASEIRCMLDSTRIGLVIGVEFLDWRRQTGGGSIAAPSPQAQVRCSYDDEIDALYIHINEERSQIQTWLMASVEMTADRQVIKIQMELPPELYC